MTRYERNNFIYAINYYRNDFEASAVLELRV